MVAAVFWDPYDRFRYQVNVTANTVLISSATPYNHCQRNLRITKTHSDWVLFNLEFTVAYLQGISLANLSVCTRSISPLSILVTINMVPDKNIFGGYELALGGDELIDS